MSEQFRQGQLVAVRDSNDSEWKLRVYDHERGGQHYCIDPAHEMSQAVWWAQVCPAEFIWPNIFLSCDREIIDSLRQELDKERQIAEQSTYVVAMESELVQRLRKQIAWLCRQIQSIADIEELGNVCPPVGMSPYYNNCQCNCIACWEQASLKAVEDADGD